MVTLTDAWRSDAWLLAPEHRPAARDRQAMSRRGRVRRGAVPVRARPPQDQGRSREVSHQLASACINSHRESVVDARRSWPRSVNDDGLLQRCVRALRAEVPELLVITDVAMDPYSSDGHDGWVTDEGEIHNDITVPILAAMAVSQARAGCRIYAFARCQRERASEANAQVRSLSLSLSGMFVCRSAYRGALGYDGWSSGSHS